MTDRVLRTGIAHTLCSACGCTVHTDDAGAVTVMRRSTCTRDHGGAMPVEIRLGAVTAMAEDLAALRRALGVAADAPVEEMVCKALLIREDSARTQGALNAAVAAGNDAYRMLDHARADPARARESIQVERDERQRTRAQMKAQRDWFAGWLIRARQALYREGWEEGMSETEMASALCDVLHNLGCDEGTEDPSQVAEYRRLLAVPVTYCPPGCKP